MIEGELWGERQRETETERELIGEKEMGGMREEESELQRE